MDYKQRIKTSNHKPVWIKAFVNGICRPDQGFGGRVEVTGTMFSLSHNNIPGKIRKDVTYGRIVVDYRPKKDEPYRTCLTVGGYPIKYPGEFRTQTVALKRKKCYSTVLVHPQRRDSCDVTSSIFILALHGAPLTYLPSNQHYTGGNTNKNKPNIYEEKWTCL